MTKKTKKQEASPANQETTETTASPAKCVCGQELKEVLQRLQAEFENFKKRTEKEKSAFIQFANKQFIMELLPVLDNFERAMQSTNDEGIKLIYNQLLEILKKHNVNEIDAIGKQFDPKLHEALLQEASDKEPNTVLEVLQKGYIVGDAVLRSAKVKVSKKNETGKV